MTKIERKPICWLRFSGYLIPWLIAEFGIKKQYEGVPLIDISAIPGVEELLHLPYIMNSKAIVKGESSFSDQLMRTIKAAYRLSPTIIKQEFGVGEKTIRDCLPIIVPDVLMAAGLNRQWNPTIQISSGAADRIHYAVRRMYWRQMMKFEDAYKRLSEVEGSEFSAEEMLEEWCRKYGISPTYMETMGRMYRREKAQNM